MDIYEQIRQDHGILRRLIDEIANPERPVESRRKLFEQLKLELRVHSRVEEALLYSKLGRERESADASLDEHRNLARILDALDGGSAESPAWTTVFERLREMLEGHMIHEESETFDWARRVIGPDEARELGDQMESGIRVIKKALSSNGRSGRAASAGTARFGARR